jgi:3-methyladenine DNA glycosylase AlkD
MPIPEYLKDLDKAYKTRANPDMAAQMKNYMKGQYEYFGIPSPERRELYKLHWKEHGLLPDNQVEEIVKWCWNAPQREFQYFALESLGKTTKKADKQMINIYEFTITHKSWWDTVDYIAANLVGIYFRKFQEEIEPKTTIWMESGNMWLQRTCLLFQLKYKSETNTILLENLIAQLSGAKEFFIRKAIGWILREYSKTNPEYVKQFVADHELSGLSEREALKWMKNKNSDL